MPVGTEDFSLLRRYRCCMAVVSAYCEMYSLFYQSAKPVSLFLLWAYCLLNACWKNRWRLSPYGSYVMGC